MAQKAANAEETAGQDEAEGPLLDGVVAAVKRLVARHKPRPKRFLSSVSAMISWTLGLPPAWRGLVAT